MSWADLYGQKLMLGLPWAYANGSDTTDQNAVKEIERLLTTYRIGNIQLSDLNYADWQSHSQGRPINERPSPETVAQQIRLVRRLMREHGIVPPPIVSIDWEGGQVQHLRHDKLAGETPSPMNFAAADRSGELI